MRTDPLAAVPAIWQEIVRLDDQREIWSLLAMCALVGAALMLEVRLAPVDYPAWYNNIGWSYHVSLVVASIFVAGLAVRWARARRVVPMALLGCAWAVGIASMGQARWAQTAKPSWKLEAAEVEALAFTRERTPLGSTVLVRANPSDGGYPWVERLGGRRVGLGWIGYLPTCRSRSWGRAPRTSLAFSTRPPRTRTSCSAIASTTCGSPPMSGSVRQDRWRPLVGEGVCRSVEGEAVCLRLDTVFDREGLVILRVRRHDYGL